MVTLWPLRARAPLSALRHDMMSCHWSLWALMSCSGAGVGGGHAGGVTSSWWIEGLSGLRNSRASKKSCQGLELEKRTCQWLASKHSGHNAENIHARLCMGMFKWARNRCSQIHGANVCRSEKKARNETEELQKNVELWWCHRHYNNPHPPTAHTHKYIQTKQMPNYDSLWKYK